MKNVYSVYQINKYIHNMFSEDYLLPDVSVEGEISNIKFHSSGHIYFTLKDEPYPDTYFEFPVSSAYLRKE